MIGIIGLIGMVVALVVEGGCAEKKAERGQERKRVREDSHEKPSQPRPYRSSCIANSSCPEPEQRNALYDLVGAFYGEEGRVRFDGTLTPDERRYVEISFGRLAAPYLDTQYLASAREKFLTRGRIPVSNLPPGRFEMSELPFFRGGFLLVGDPFHCERPALCDRLETRLTGDPSNWILVIDRYALRDFMPDAITEVFARLSATLGIPTIDPFLPPWDERIAGEMEGTYEVSRLESAARFLFIACSDRAAQRTDTDCFDPAVAMVEKGARYFGVPELELEAAYRQFMGTRSTRTEDLDLSRQNRQARAWFRRYLLTATELLYERLPNTLATYPHRQILFYLRPNSHELLRRAGQE